jgi:hypothetical protein
MAGHRDHNIRRWLATPTAADALALSARLTAHQSVILRRALLVDEPRTYSALARELGTSRQHVHLTIQALIELGLLTLVKADDRTWRAEPGELLMELADQFPVSYGA